MTSTQEMWIVAWREVDLRIRQGPLTQREAQRPTSAAAKHLFPTVFKGLLDKAYYEAGNVTGHNDADTMSQDHLTQVVKDCEPVLLQLTLLSERLKSIYRRHRVHRIRHDTPQDLYLPIARDVFLTIGPEASDDELERCLLAEWAPATEAWAGHVATTMTVNDALARREVRSWLQGIMTEHWSQRLTTPVVFAELKDRETAVLALWRNKVPDPGLGSAWEALQQTLNKHSLDAWAAKNHLSTDPAAMPSVIGHRHTTFLARPLNQRFRSVFQTGPALPPLKQFLHREATRTAHPVGLAEPSSRAAFMLGVSAASQVPVEARPWDALAKIEQDQAHEKSVEPADRTNPSLLRMLARDWSYRGLLPREPQHPRRGTPDPTATTGQHDQVFRPATSRLAGHVDLSGLVNDPWLGPHYRLWPRLLGKEMAGQPVVTAPDACAVILEAIYSWANDVTAGRFRGRKLRPTPDIDPLEAHLSLAAAERREVLDALHLALPPNDTPPDTGPFHEVWERLFPDDTTITWEQALHIFRNHRRGAS